MKNLDFYAGLFLMVLGFGSCIMSYLIGLGSYSEPGAGFIPFGIGAFLGLMSIGLIFRTLNQSEKVRQGKETFRGIVWKRVILVMCLILGYGLAINSLGFRLSTFFLMILLLRVVSSQKWWFVLVFSFLTTVGTYLIFVVWLGCQFPKGFLGI